MSDFIHLIVFRQVCCSSMYKNNNFYGGRGNFAENCDGANLFRSIPETVFKLVFTNLISENQI